MNQYEIELKTQEGAEITAELNTTYVNYKAVIGDAINVIRISKNQKMTILQVIF